MAEENGFKEWCLIELFGHQRIVGLVSDQVIGGEIFIRVDVPETKRQSAFTKMYGKGAVYCLSPLAEDVAKSLIDKFSQPPVARYELPSHDLIEGSDEKDEEENPFN